jgi:hypothetical protein
MLLLNASALGQVISNRFMHLPSYGAATILRGILPVLRRRQGWLMPHYSNMAWSYIALLRPAARSCCGCRLAPVY